jgi:hypothetical protein
MRSELLNDLFFPNKAIFLLQAKVDPLISVFSNEILLKGEGDLADLPHGVRPDFRP